MARILLHIGAPKTGSSFLQKWLAKNRDTLGEQGVNVLAGGSAHRIAVEYIDQRIVNRRDVVGIRESMSLSDALAPLDPGRMNVISSEYFFHASPEFLSSLFVGKRSEVTSIVCFLRRQDILLASGYAQEIKAGNTSRKPITNVIYNEDYDWLRLLSRWRYSFPFASAQFYNYDAVKTNLLAFFRSSLPPVADTSDEVEQVNESLSAEMVEIARVLNERGISFTPQDIIAAQKDRTPFSFSQEITSAFEAAYIEANRNIGKMLPGRFDDFARPNWTAAGADMTGIVSDARIQEVVEQLGRRG